MDRNRWPKCRLCKRSELISTESAWYWNQHWIESVYHGPLELSPFLSRYLCHFLDTQSLLNLQITNRWFCVITRQHPMLTLLMMISPYYSQFHFPATNQSSYIQSQPSLQYHTENGLFSNELNGINESRSSDNNRAYSHSVDQSALNSGYYKVEIWTICIFQCLQFNALSV